MVFNGSSFNGLVLAGGRSTRMGQDKALLRCPNGDTLVQRAGSLLQSVGAQQVYISSQNSQLSEALSDEFPHRGPVSGIHAALTQTEKTPLLVLPVDMPLMSPEILKELLRTGFNQDVSCCYRDQCLPLLVMQPEMALTKAREMLSGKGNVSVWRFIKAIAGKELEANAEKAFKNANDPQQWQECLQLLSANKELS